MACVGITLPNLANHQGVLSQRKALLYRKNNAAKETQGMILKAYIQDRRATALKTLFFPSTTKNSYKLKTNTYPKKDILTG